jgi:hypothetical protein
LRQQIVLPYKTEPQPQTTVLGTSETGQVELTKLGDLSLNEYEYLESLMAEFPNSRLEVVRVAKTIADASNTPILAVVDALQSGDAALFAEHLEDFVNFQTQMSQLGRQRQLAMATTLIRFRLDPEWTIEQTKDAKQIHPALVQAIADFGAKEESHWQPPEPITEEDLGKSSGVKANKSRTGPKSTSN